MGHQSLICDNRLILHNQQPYKHLKDRVMDYKLTIEALEARIAPVGWSLGGQ